MSGESFHLENQELTQAAAMTLCTDLLLLLTVGVCCGWGCCLSWEMFSSSSGWMGEEMGKGEEKTIKQKCSVSLSWSAKKKNKIKWDEVHEDSGDLSQDTHLGESYPGLHLLDSWISRAFTLLLSDSRLSHWLLSPKSTLPSLSHLCSCAWLLHRCCQVLPLKMSRDVCAAWVLSRV